MCRSATSFVVKLIDDQLCRRISFDGSPSGRGRLKAVDVNVQHVQQRMGLRSSEILQRCFRIDVLWELWPTQAEGGWLRVQCDTGCDCRFLFICGHRTEHAKANQLLCKIPLIVLQFVQCCISDFRVMLLVLSPYACNRVHWTRLHAYGITDGNRNPLHIRRSKNKFYTN